MRENLFDHFLIFDESDDSHLTLALGAGQGINLIKFLNQPPPNSFDIPWMIPLAPECMVSIHPGFVSSVSFGKHYCIGN
jgi:hypothetical protein